MTVNFSHGPMATLLEVILLLPASQVTHLPLAALRETTFPPWEWTANFSHGPTAPLLANIPFPDGWFMVTHLFYHDLMTTLWFPTSTPHPAPLPVWVYWESELGGGGDGLF